MTGPDLSPPVRLSGRTLAVLSAAAVLFLLTRQFLLPGGLVRMAMAGLVTLAAFLARPRTSTLLFVSPMVLVLGGTVVEIGVFHPCHATLFGFLITGFWLVEKAVWNEPFRIPAGAGLRAGAWAAALQTASIAVSIHVNGQDFWNAVRDGTSLFIFYPLSLVAVDTLQEPGAVTRLMRSAVIALLTAALIGIFQYYGITGFSRIDMGIGYVYRGRVAATLGNPNVFAGYLELSLPVALAMFFHEKRPLWRALSLSAAVLGFLATLYTFSRGGFLMTILGSALVLVYRYRGNPAVPAAAGALLAAGMAMNADLFARQLSIVTSPTDIVTQPTLVHRYITYNRLWQQVKLRPVEGIGWGAKEFYSGRTPIYTFWDIRHTTSRQEIGSFGGLNNLFLNQALKGGVLSVAALLLMGAAAARASARALRAGAGMRAVGPAVGLLTFAIHQLVDNLVRWPQTNGIFWLWVGLLAFLGTAEGRGVQDQG